MKLQITPVPNVQGEATPPSSKSHTVRALMFATLSPGTSVLRNILDSEDSKAAIEVCRNLGATITTTTNSHGGLDCVVESQGVPLVVKGNKLFAANSGITTTFAIPIVGLRKNTELPMTLQTGEQMMQRPLGSIIDAVNALGMNVTSLKSSGHSPLQLQAQLRGGRTTVDGMNSQYLSALLIALPCAPEDSTLEVYDLHERPYVEMTLAWLDEQGIHYEHSRKDICDTFKIIGRQTYKPFTKNIPADFSSASYLIAAGVLLPGCITLHGLDMNDPQGDKQLITLLQKLGADIKVDGTDVIIKGGNPLKGGTIDCSDIPDLLPTLAVIGTQTGDTLTLTNIEHARIKETDRVQSMASELRKMGATIEETETSLIIHKSKLYCAKLHGYNDHRTIMALAVAAMLATPSAVDTTTIDTAEGINKTFPAFVTFMNSFGATMRITP